MNNSSSKVPSLRFPAFKNDPAWEEKKLGDVGKLVSGLTYSPNDVRNNGLLVLRSSNVQRSKITLDDNVYVRADIKGANFSESNDILICVRNGSKALIGKNALIPNGMPLCTHGAFMTVFRSEISKFAYQLFQTSSYIKQVEADLGATINSINGNLLKKYIFYIPKPLEQQKIADCLTSLDDLITARSLQVESLKQHKKGLMQQLFPQANATIPNLRFPVFKNVPAWEEEKLGDVTSISTGRSNREDSSATGGQYTFFDRSQDVRTSGIFLFDGEAIIVAGEGQKFLPKYFFGKFDLHQRTYAIMNFKGILGKFIFYYIYQNRSYFLSQAVGSTVKSLRLPMFEKMPIILPLEKEQQKIADCLTSLDDLITAKSLQIESLKQHKKGLMQQLFPNNETSL